MYLWVVDVSCALRVWRRAARSVVWVAVSIWVWDGWTGKKCLFHPFLLLQHLRRRIQRGT